MTSDTPYQYRDFSGRPQEVFLSDIVSIEKEPMGSCYMITACGERLSNMSGYNQVRELWVKAKSRIDTITLTRAELEGMRTTYSPYDERDEGYDFANQESYDEGFNAAIDQILERMGE